MATLTTKFDIGDVVYFATTSPYRGGGHEMTAPAKTVDQNFADWEGDAFGLGYGTGEPHTIPAIRSFLRLCNRNDGARAYDYEAVEAELGETVTWLLINALCKLDIIEYGTSPRYGWLTTRGEALRKYMLSRDKETLIRLACEHDDHCYPTACNCDGYVEGKVCVNPFWQDDAARSYLSDGALNPQGSK